MMLSFEQRFTALLYLHNFDEEVTFSWKRDGMSERKYFDLQIVKFTSLNSLAFNKMFKKSCIHTPMHIFGLTYSF